MSAATDANNKSPGATPDMSTAVNRPGGVKALLQQLNHKYTDSHVKLPDGTNLEASSGRKFATPKKPARWEVGGGGSPAQPADDGAARGGSGGGASGVKARLAEINSKYTAGSHVQLPDGSVLSAKRPASNEEKPSEASTQDLPVALNFPPDALNGLQDSAETQEAAVGGYGEAPIELPGHGSQAETPFIPDLQEEKPFIPDLQEEKAAPPPKIQGLQQSSKRNIFDEQEGGEAPEADTSDGPPPWAPPQRPSSSQQPSTGAQKPPPPQPQRPPPHGEQAVARAEQQARAGERRSSPQRGSRDVPGGSPFLPAGAQLPSASPRESQNMPANRAGQAPNGGGMPPPSQAQGAAQAGMMLPPAPQLLSAPAMRPATHSPRPAAHSPPVGYSAAGPSPPLSYSSSKGPSPPMGYPAGGPAPQVMRRSPLQEEMAHPHQAPPSQLRATLSQEHPPHHHQHPQHQQRPPPPPPQHEQPDRYQQQQQAPQFRRAPDAGTSLPGRGDAPQASHTRQYNAGFGREPPSSDYPSQQALSSASMNGRVRRPSEQGEMVWGGDERVHRSASGGSQGSGGAYSDAPPSSSFGRHSSDLGPPPSSSSSSGRQTLKTFGIGVNFKRTSTGNYQVAKVLPGGTGAESGLIFVGDIMSLVDGIRVAAVTQKQFYDLIVGEDGSGITLSFEKPGARDPEALIHVALHRGPCEAPGVTREVSAPLPVVPLTPTGTPKGASSMPRVLMAKVIKATPVHGSQASSSRTPNQPPTAASPQGSDSSLPDMASVSTRSSGDGPGLAGVGILFEADRRGLVRVAKLEAAGAAAAEGQIQVGDVVAHVNGESVADVAGVEQRVVGAPGSSIVIGIRSGQVAGAPTRPVRLVRSHIAGPCKVVEMLLLGDAACSRNRAQLHQVGVSCIMNCAAECVNHFERELAYTNLSFQDKTTENLRRSFDQAADMIQRNMDLNLTTLVHCSDGRGRAAAVCVAFLMRKKRTTLKQAWLLVKRVWPIKPPLSFLAQLIDYERDLNGTTTMHIDEYASAVSFSR